MERWTSWASMVVILALAGSGAAAADDLTLVADGKAACVVVISPEASPSERWAAEEMVSYLKQMSGATVEMLPHDPPQDKAVILIGGTSLPKGDPIRKDLVALGTDGYVIKTGRNRLVIAGGEKRGTMYGVFTLLERLGVRWWTPAETFVPQAKTITVLATDLREVPRLEYRDVMFRESWDGDAARAWYAHNKVNGFSWEDVPEKFGGRYAFWGNLVHSYNRLLELSGMEIKPEMRALRNGKRTDSQPCLTNPDTVKAMTAGVLKAFEQSPESQFVVVGQEDNAGYCQCDACKALAEKEGPSGMVIQFANQVAKAAEKVRPGSCIATPAYEWSRQPPKTLKPRDNVYITLCSIECDFAHPLATSATEHNVKFRDDIVAWGKIAPKLIIWDYVVNFHHYLMPHPNLDVLAPNIKFFADNRAAGYFAECGQTGRATENEWMRLWVLAKALWNPEADNQELVAEFVRGYFGSASEPMRKYFDIMQRFVRRNPDVPAGTYMEFNAPFLVPSDLAEAEQALREAEAAAQGHPDIERRVRHAHMPIWYVLTIRGPGSATWRAVEAKVGKMDYAQVAERLLAVVKEWRVSHTSEHDAGAPWFAWLADHAKAVASGTPPLPPELEGRDLSKVRLIYPGMMDGKVGWLAKAEGTTDGWTMVCKSTGWYSAHHLSSYDDFAPGKKYRVFVRTRGEVAADAKAPAWYAGVYGTRQGARKEVASLRRTAEEVREEKGQWRVHQLGPFEPSHGDYFYVALRDPSVMKEVLIDCYWLEEVDSKTP
ncbi:MAG: DUF4838 domain-containing protein [Planctomycetes bacterium]|nr:DUF4838 domain-containing protein [Planctomycetota bacterium]